MNTLFSCVVIVIVLPNVQFQSRKNLKLSQSCLFKLSKGPKLFDILIKDKKAEISFFSKKVEFRNEKSFGPRLLLKNIKHNS